MNNIAYIKDLINEYYKKAPWYDLDGKEIACDEFIMINLEEKEYEEKSMGKIYGDGKTH